jgi:predicted RNA-binding Zn-ribbon protein involved in translation (DUF1610 family)
LFRRSTKAASKLSRSGMFETFAAVQTWEKRRLSACTSGPPGKVRWMITYKAARLGMPVALVDERYTSRVCPACGRCYKPLGRVYRCRACRGAFHRDLVGAHNMRAKIGEIGLFPELGFTRRKAVWRPPPGCGFIRTSGVARPAGRESPESDGRTSASACKA